MTTYGNLIASASAQLQLGARQLRAEPFWSSTEATAALLEYHGALDAIAGQARRLLWIGRSIAPETTRYRTDLARGELAARDLADAISALVGPDRPHPSMLRPPRTPWGAAAQHVRAATDLVATHFDRIGVPRTPDVVPVADTAVRRAALADVATVASAVLAAEEPLALRCLQAGLAQRTVLTALPGMTRMTGLARMAAAPEPNAATSTTQPLDTLAQAFAPPPVDEPLAELEARLLRLRSATRNVVGDAHGSLPLLRDASVAGIAVTAHAAAFHGADLQRSTAAHGSDSRLAAHARAWQHQHAALATFITLDRPPDVVREDVIATARLLEQLAPLTPVGTPADLEAARPVGAALNGALAVVGDIARYSEVAFADLARRRVLLVDARTVPRDLVTDDAALVQARLQRGIVPAPEAMVAPVIAGFAQLSQVGLAALAPPRGIARSVTSRTSPPVLTMVPPGS